MAWSPLAIANALKTQRKRIAMVSQTLPRMYQTLEIPAQTRRTTNRGVGINKPTPDFNTAALCATFVPLW
jgi:hypothetical protein